VRFAALRVALGLLEIDAAVIVTGSRGLRAVSELFEGSVSHDVAEHAGRPVLIVPPAKAAL
jgi:nucleotide-binding universal stress UspA family protein